MPSQFILFAPDQPNAQREKHMGDHVKYITGLPSILFCGLFMPPSNIGLTEHAIPLETAGTTFIYAAETLEEAEGLAHGDPFWSSGEVWDKAQVKIIPVSVVINNLPTKKFP